MLFRFIAPQKQKQQQNNKKTTNKQKHITICVEHHYAQTSTNNVNKTWSLLQITGSKDEANIVNLSTFYWNACNRSGK